MNPGGLCHRPVASVQGGPRPKSTQRVGPGRMLWTQRKALGVGRQPWFNLALPQPSHQQLHSGPFPPALEVLPGYRRPGFSFLCGWPELALVQAPGLLPLPLMLRH